MGVDGPNLACFEKDKNPVDTEEIFEGLCEDIHGNKYEEYSETSSCCECLSYTCQKFQITKEWSVLMWNTSVSDRCCQSCDGVVYKADSIIDTVHFEDECQTTELSVCRILPDLDKAVVNEEFKYKKCCIDEKGLSSLETKS